MRLLQWERGAGEFASSSKYIYISSVSSESSILFVSCCWLAARVAATDREAGELMECIGSRQRRCDLSHTSRGSRLGWNQEEDEIFWREWNFVARQHQSAHHWWSHNQSIYIFIPEMGKEKYRNMHRHEPTETNIKTKTSLSEKSMLPWCNTWHLPPPVT